MRDLHQQKILILDFGSQYTQLIARRVREVGVYSEILPWDVGEDAIRAFNPRGIILSGGPESAAADNAPRPPALVFECGVPVLGICYGMQAMARHFGGSVAGADGGGSGGAGFDGAGSDGAGSDGAGSDGADADSASSNSASSNNASSSNASSSNASSSNASSNSANSNGGEFGYAQVRVADEAGLLHDIRDHLDEAGRGLLEVWMSHGDRVDRLPEGFVLMAETDSCPIAGMHHRDLPLYGIQFHPEVTHTLQGRRIIEHFALELCGCDALWTPANIIEDAINQVQATVGGDDVLLGLSGGVDSAVVAALLHRAIGSQLTCVFVDNGLLRKDEGDQVMAMFASNMGIRVVRSDAEDLFLARLAGVDEPERKRKIIGNTFIEVFAGEAARLDNIKWLAQGTIYPDVIESAGASTGKAHVIKSHHNVGGLPDDMPLKLVEPLRELFKDEVRQIGLELGLPHDMVYRHPFPGPGLGVRILGEVKKEYADLLREADAIFMEELRAAGYYHKTSQAFAVFLPVKSVGVVGDGRRYEYVVALRAVETVDFMTARWAHLPHSLLERVSGRIINEIPGVSRVVYDVSGKPPATIEWE